MLFSTTVKSNQSHMVFLDNHCMLMLLQTRANSLAQVPKVTVVRIQRSLQPSASLSAA